eukprot:18366_1
MTHFGLDLLLVSITILQTVHSQTSSYYYQSASLTTTNTYETGANITILKDINIANNAWNTNVTDEIGYHMLINLNNSWGFNPNVLSTLTLTVNGTTSMANDPRKDLIISFSVSNNQYFAIYLSIDGGNNKIYPRDNPLAIGDIKSIVDATFLYTYNTRQRKASNGTNFKGHGMQPNVKTLGYNAWPLIIKIQNNPNTNTVNVTLTNPSLSITPFKQTTQFLTSFTPNSGMQIYIAGDQPSDASIAITQFTLEYTYNFTMNPTNNPTSNPSFSPSNIPTQNPSKIPSETPTSTIPTITPTNNPSNIPTQIPTNIPTHTTHIPTQNPSNTHSEAPTSKIPTVSPSIPPTTSINPSTSPSQNPTSQFDTKTPSSIPSIIPISFQTSLIPTDYPTAAPTSRPTRSPTKRPTVTPTMPTNLIPTIAPILRICKNWKLEISFNILKYIRMGEWETILQALCVNAFKQTILSLSNIIIWNDMWCVNIEIKFEIESDDRRLRRMLLQSDLEIKTGNDIEIKGEFDVNNILYNDFFREYDSTEFKIEYMRILSELIGTNADGISDFELEEPFKIDNRKPTYAPNALEIRDGDENRTLIIIILFACFGSICCIVIGITCALFYKYEKEYESETYEMLQAVSPIPMDAKNEQKFEDGFPKTIEMERTVKNNKFGEKKTEGYKFMGMHDKYKVGSQSEFEAHLTNNVVVGDIIMDDIIQHIVCDVEAKSDEDSDEDVIDYDMQQYVLTPQ